MNYPQLLVTLQFGIIALMILFSKGVWGSFLGMGISLFGLALGVWAIRDNQRENFNIQPNLKEGCKLITTGIYHWIRHPMYSAVIIMMLGVVVSTPTWFELILFLGLIVILVLKAKREERLWCHHDVNYISYQRETKLFIPYIL